MTILAEKKEKLSLDVTSPFDGSLIKTITIRTEDEALDMLNKAAALFKNRDGWIDIKERISILNRLASFVSDESEDFAMMIAREGGKPLIDARVEVARAIDGIHLAVEELDVLFAPQEVPMTRTQAAKGHKATINNEPIGVVVAVSAFNHPLNLIVHQVVPAIAVGCPVIIKPASSTPLNCIRFVELVHKAGLPEDWCQVCVCNNAVAEILVTSPKINFFSFIGSAKVGWWLKSKLAAGVRCALEHGGVAPVIVDKTAILGKTIPSLLKGGFYHAGQVCVSVQRIFTHEYIADELAKQLADAAENLKVGDATKEDTEVGPLIFPHEVDRVDEWVREAIRDGADLLTGGKKLSDTTYAPTVLLNPPADAKVSTLEIFGPVVCVYTYSDRVNAIKQANSLDVAFQAAVYSEDSEVVDDCIKRLDASAVMVNDHTAFRVDWMPFGGRKHSGYGIGGIGYTMHDMTQIKMTVIKES